MNIQLVPIEFWRIPYYPPLPLFCPSLELSHLCVSLHADLGTSFMNKIIFLLALSMIHPNGELLLSSTTTKRLHFHLMTGTD